MNEQEKNINERNYYCAGRMRARKASPRPRATRAIKVYVRTTAAPRGIAGEGARINVVSASEDYRAKALQLEFPPFLLSLAL